METKLVENNPDEAKDYGSMEKPDDREAFLTRLDTYGGAKVLLIQAWVSLAPILAPLLIVDVETIHFGDLLVRCDWHFEATRPSRWFCDVTYVCLCIFPCLCRMMAILVATYALTRQRLFYVLLKHKILLNLEHGNLVKNVMKSVVLVFLGACCHIVLLWLWGFKRSRQDGRFHGEFMLGDLTFEKVLQNPRILYAEENTQLLVSMFRGALHYIVPGTVALSFAAANVQDPEMSLVPSSKLFAEQTCYVHKHLGESVRVDEDVTRDIVEEDMQAASDEVAVDRSLSGTCAKFREAALSFETTDQVGGVLYKREGQAPKDTDIENDVSKGALRLAERPEMGAWESTSMKWWQLSIILRENDLDKEDPSSFHKCWVLHACLCMLFFIMDICFLMYGVFQGYSDVVSEEGWCVSSEVACAAVSIPLIIVNTRLVTGFQQSCKPK